MLLRVTSIFDIHVPKQLPYDKDEQRKTVYSQGETQTYIKQEQSFEFEFCWKGKKTKTKNYKSREKKI